MRSTSDCGWRAVGCRRGPAARLDALMSAQVVHHLVRLPYRHFERNPLGVIAERLRQLDVLRGFFTGQHAGARDRSGLRRAVPAGAVRHQRLLGMVAVLGDPVAVGGARPDPSRAAPPGRRVFQALAAKSSALTETVANAATVKALGPRSRGREALAGAGRAARRRTTSAPAILPTSPPAPRPACSCWRCCHRAGRRARDRRPSPHASAAWSPPTAGGARAAADARSSRRPGTSCRRRALAFARLDELMAEPAESAPGGLAPMPPLAAG